jgi:nicotinamidase-related amidase
MTLRFIPGDTVKVPEIAFADEIRLPAARTAVVVVDMQNDFVKPGGALVVEAAAETIPRIQKLLEAARAHDVHVVYTQDTHIEGDVEWEEWPDHVLEGSWGWHIIDELAPQPGDLVCRKNRYDGFYGTWMDHYLGHVWEVKYVVIVGTVSNICVLHTAASAGLRYFHVVTPADAISALNDFDQALTLRQVSWLYSGTAVRSASNVSFEDVISVQVPRRRMAWCPEPGEDELAAMTPQEQRIAELEAQLCEREAVITTLKDRLGEA